MPQNNMLSICNVSHEFKPQIYQVCHKPKNGTNISAPLYSMHSTSVEVGINYNRTAKEAINKLLVKA